MKTFIFLLLLFSTTGYTPPTRPLLAMNIVTHDEAGKGYDSLYYKHFDSICMDLLEFAELCQKSGAVWHMGCSESIITAVEKYTKTSTIIFPKDINNILEYLQDIYGVVIDVHTHDVPAYGELACRLFALDVTPSRVMSGFLYRDHDWVPWTTMTSPVVCDVTKDEWQPGFLWGAGTPEHKTDPEEYGMWKPNSETDFNAHNTANTLWYYGDGPQLKIEADGRSTIDVITVLDNRVRQMARARIPSDYLYPTSILIQESRLSEEGMIDALGVMIKAINSRHDNIKWIRIDEALKANALRHGGHGFQLDFDFSRFRVL